MAATWIAESLTTRAYRTITATVANTALSMLDFGFTAAELAQAVRARITTATADVLMAWDGTVPVIATPVGHRLTAGILPWDLWGTENITALQLIRQAGVSAVVTITLER